MTSQWVWPESQEQNHKSWRQWHAFRSLIHSNRYRAQLTFCNLDFISFIPANEYYSGNHLHLCLDSILYGISLLAKMQCMLLLLLCDKKANNAKIQKTHALSQSEWASNVHYWVIDFTRKKWPQNLKRFKQNSSQNLYYERGSDCNECPCCKIFPAELMTTRS